VITTGLFALAGVIIGGVLNGVVTAEIEKRRAARESWVAARLIMDDLMFIHVYLTSCLQQMKWAGGWSLLNAETWGLQRERLATALEFNDWSAVIRAFAKARLIAMRAQAADVDEPIDDTEGEIVTQALREIDDARKALLKIESPRARRLGTKRAQTEGAAG
jgi:DNA-directed RNA polymerase subunit K/omega